VPIRRAAEKKKTAPEAVTAAPNGGATKQTENETRAQAVERILRTVEKKMSSEDLKATLGDYIRLIQLAKEIGEEPKSEIKVTWIEEPAILPEE
jgi:hypothetical protein